MNGELARLYEATGEDMEYTIGTVQLQGLRPLPIIQIMYAGWSRKKLQAVRACFSGGLILAEGRRKDKTIDVYIGTKERMSLQARDGEDTSVLRAPAWDAHMASVDAGVFVRFQRERQQFGGFLLLIRAGSLEFMTASNESENEVEVGAILISSVRLRFITRLPPIALTR